MIPVILSGGSGTRLWPVSRSKYPKQFCELFDESLQTKTIKRVSKFGNPIIVTSEALRDFTQKKAIEAGFSKAEILYEPMGKNTAPAIALLCRYLELNGKQSEVVSVFPADHLIEKEDVFVSALELAETCARDGKIVTLGLKPNSPNTGYGYIQTDKQPFSYKKNVSSHRVLKFHEKPHQQLAEEFLKEGNYYWNAGIFVFQVSTMIDLLDTFAPQIWDALSSLKADLTNLKEIYSGMPNISIDYAIMEKLNSNDQLCVPCDPKWSDVGSWDAVAEVYSRQKVQKTAPFEVDSKENFVLPADGKTYAFVGVEELIVVDTADALLISKKGHSQDVKVLVDQLKASKSPLIHQHVFEERPWGRFEILRDFPHFKSKVIKVNPQASISYQSHDKREEHWIITKGEGEVVLDEQIIKVKKGSYVKIPLKAKHRIRNLGTEVLEFVEVQLGTYFGEDDIVRYQDEYNRV